MQPNFLGCLTSGSNNSSKQADPARRLRSRQPRRATGHRVSGTTDLPSAPYFLPRPADKVAAHLATFTATLAISATCIKCRSRLATGIVLVDRPAVQCAPGRFAWWCVRAQLPPGCRSLRAASRHPLTAPGLDAIIHTPKRLAIMALLDASVDADFAFLREHFDFSESDLSKQLKLLAEAGT
jgi:hypothetical protein